MKFRNLKLILASTAISLVFVACGSDDTPDTKTGTFTAGAPVKGLSYSTATKSGTTNDAGQFKYIAGETVTFKIGGKLNIGSATGASKISLYNINKLENFQENKTNEISAVKNSSSFFKIFDTQNGNISIVSINSTELANINDTALQDINFSDATNLTAVIAKALDVTTDTANNNYTKRKDDSNYDATNSYASLESNFVNYIYGENLVYNNLALTNGNTTRCSVSNLNITLTGITSSTDKDVSISYSGVDYNITIVTADNNATSKSSVNFDGDSIDNGVINGDANLSSDGNLSSITGPARFINFDLDVSQSFNNQISGNITIDLNNSIPCNYGITTTSRTN